MQDLAYPRPQLRRAKWTSLDGRWRFAFDTQTRDRTNYRIENWPLEIEVPYAPESSWSGIGDRGFHHACWYERDFALTEAQLAPDRRVLLHFGAVDYYARVWVNDLRVAEHEGGHTPFSADITRALRRTGLQRVRVWAEDDPHDLEKPRGKQDWRLEPHGIWYPRTTGIWQTVWLEDVPETYIGALRWMPNVERWEIALSAFIEGTPAEELQLSVRLTARGKVLAQDSYAVIGNEVHRRVGLSDPGIEDFRNELLWSPERPTLIDAEVKLLHRGHVIDEVASYTALRSIGVQREKILLNGRPYNMRLVLDQGYWPDTLMTPPSEEAIRRDVELTKAMGFNGVRKHQKIEDPRYLYWADRLGLLVFGEMPSAYRFTTRSIRRLLREWTEAIERDMSHPCLVMWVPFNESWGVPELSAVSAHRDAVAALYHLTKTLDPSRLVIGNDGWESSATDVIGIHDYDTDPNHLRVRYGPEVKPQEVVDRRWSGGRILTLDGYPHRGQPICLSEFGGIAYVPEEDARAHQDEWGYAVTRTREEYERIVCGLIEVARTTELFSAYCYTQFADTFQEVNGLLYPDRTPKLPLERIAQAVAGPPQSLPYA
ncbi:MAG: glycoside hydrolase family 2 [Gammaproteobacteria bacterium]|nr:glycoside hydrolase family 2 [Gammaproteobacteria bacterium]